MRPRQSNFWKVFGAPVLIGVLCAAGLFSALLGDGAWDAVSWVGLGLPTLLGTWGLFKRNG
ncbi:hypothetical protein SAMN03159376_01120 [Pseudomonas sp. NFACC09-4]|uniref:hypothetical protein n=1 Tax=Pseudomonas TaxID=286 RepID=UPI000908C28A|nr:MULTISPECIES: hypothetical protein [Pseudomonas]MDT8908634.1 hypothetical protein [Pseudomonas prosekii]NHN71379.1 hypothetical protein [Pseudomonas fluorescens]ROO41516.1 hypothetical protein BIV08_11640 [Pseudomonas sp. AF76]ROO42197.1 hypothetical protein BIV09_06765 [Pseudomonas sp. 7SR1]SFW35426.1 hypothetical protein SAMN03159376_01120 [Pseudomonas sp. NFACC09-4]